MNSTRAQHRIVSVRAYFHETNDPEPEPIEDDSTEKEAAHWLQGKVANQMSRYAEFRDNRSMAIGPRAGRGVIIQVESASGHVGVATTSGGLAAAAISGVLHGHLRVCSVADSGGGYS